MNIISLLGFCFPPNNIDFSRSSKQCKYLSSDKMDTFFQVLPQCAWRQIMQINGVLPFPIGSAAIFRDIRLFPKKNTRQNPCTFLLHYHFSVISTGANRASSAQSMGTWWRVDFDPLDLIHLPT